MRSRRPRARLRKAETPEVVELVSEQTAVPYDESLLESARTQWQFGDWESLARLDIEGIQHHPYRSRLALFAAAGRFQQGELNDACRFLRLAQDWGCSNRLVVQVLVSGMHNTLGCANVLLGRELQALGHFHSAVTLGGVPGDARLLSDVRVRRQRSRLDASETHGT